VGILPIWKSLRDHSDEKLTFLFKYFLFRFLRTLLHATKNQLFYFQAFRTFAQNTPGWGIPAPPGAKYKPDASGLLIDVVFGFQRFSNGWRNGLFASGAPLIACSFP